jgi:hypothetical protein
MEMLLTARLEKHIISRNLNIAGKKNFLKPNSPITVSMDGRISCRLYPDARPQCLEIAQLQKGLVLMLDGKELIEEGVGFGAPVALYEDRPFFSRTAECSLQTEGDCTVLVKKFVLDAVSRKRIGSAFYVNEGFYKFFHARYHATYVNHKRLTPAFNRLMELRGIFRVNTEFVRVKPRGTVTVRYTCRPNSIQVEVSLSAIDKDRCKEILILNEQGASFFRRYSDADGVTLVDGQIGAMETVKAEKASITNINGTISFCLRNMEGTTFFRGREKTRGRFSWIGLGYTVKPSLTNFTYDIEIEKTSG